MSNNRKTLPLGGGEKKYVIKSKELKIQIKIVNTFARYFGL